MAVAMRMAGRTPLSSGCSRLSALVNAPDAGVGAVEVALQHRLERLALADLGEEGLGHVVVFDGDIAGTEQRRWPCWPVSACAGRPPGSAARRACAGSRAARPTARA